MSKTTVTSNYSSVPRELAQLGNLYRRTNRLSRDQWIIVSVKMGFARSDIARMVGLSEARVSQIVKEGGKH